MVVLWSFINSGYYMNEQRQYELEQAIKRAEQHLCTPADIETIKQECGLLEKIRDVKPGFESIPF